MENNTIIDLSAETLDESWLRIFGAGVESILKGMFGGHSVPVTVRGSQSEINSFANTLSHEKRYMDSYQKFGLDNPMTYRSKFKLNKAVRDFERKTNLKWPLR